MIALDTETELIEVGNQIPRLVCVSLAEKHPIGPGMISEVFPWTNDPGRLVGVLAGPVVGHNIAFDLLVLARAFPDILPVIFAAYDADRVTDTGLRAKLLDIADGRRTWVDADDAPNGVRRSEYTLQALTKRYTGRDLDKTQVRLEYAALRDVPFDRWPTAAVEYSRADAVATFDVWAAQRAREPELGDQYRQARAELALRLASSWGLVPNPEAVRALTARVDRELDEHGAVLRSAGLMRSDGTRNMDAVQARVFSAFANDPPRTDTGRAKTDRETLERTTDAALLAYATYAKLLAIRRKDLPPAPGDPPRKHPATLELSVVHTRFETLVETGRTASSAPNVQNLSQEGGVRECFQAREGCAYVVADYAGMELSTWAQVCFDLFGRSALRDRILAGIDSHLTLAAALSGRSYEELQEHRKDPDVYTLRQTGKVANFGLMGGMGATRFAQQARKKGVPLTEGEARRVIQAWHEINPEAALYFRYVDQHETVEQPRSGRVRAGASYTERCNSYFQGLGADMFKDALYRVARAQHVGGMVARTCNEVHDELVVETPIEEVDATARAVEELMLAAARVWLPDVPCGVEVHATRVYSKSAKRVVRDGRLVVWEPS